MTTSGLKKVSEEGDFALVLKEAVSNTLAATSIRVKERMSFPSSSDLLDVDEVRKLGTGLWEQVTEFVAPDRVHYVSSSEDGGFEGFRVGNTLVYRMRGPGDDFESKWGVAGDEAAEEDELAQADISWMKEIKSPASLLDAEMTKAVQVKKVADDMIGGKSCFVLEFKVPAWDEKFKKEVSTDGETLRPVRYQVKTWVSKEKRPLIYRFEDVYVYKTEDGSRYEYVVGTRTYDVNPRLAIELPPGSK